MCRYVYVSGCGKESQRVTLALCEEKKEHEYQVHTCNIISQVQEKQNYRAISLNVGAVYKVRAITFYTSLFLM